MELLRRNPVRAGTASGALVLVAVLAGCSLGTSGASGPTSTIPSTAFRTIPISPPKPTEPSTSAPPGGATSTATRLPQQQLSLPPNVRAIYTVKAGDAPAGIARKFSVPLEALYEMNGINPKKPAVFVGQKLQIPRILPPTTVNDKGEKVYIVVPGDSPLGIANKFGIALQTLIDLNGLDPAKLAVYVGQAMKVPG